MERIKRNPGGYGLALGGAIGIVSVLFTWVSVTNTVTNVTTSVPTRSRQRSGKRSMAARMCASRPTTYRVRGRSAVSARSITAATASTGAPFAPRLAAIVRNAAARSA